MKSLDIIYENEDFIALNKIAGVLSIPDRTQSSESLKDLLIKKYGTIFTVHRLDKDTSGVIIFAKTETTHQFLSQAFEERVVEKFYLGLVHGSLINPTGSVDAPMAEHPGKNGKMVVYKKGKPSLTDYKVLEDYGTYSLLEFQIHTGRTHQIRVHMQHIGHAIVCDELYGNGEPVLISSLKRNFKLSKKEEEERPILQRLALHSARLAFTDEKGIHHNLEAPMPKDLRALLQQLKKWK